MGGRGELNGARRTHTVLRLTCNRAGFIGHLLRMCNNQLSIIQSLHRSIHGAYTTSIRREREDARALSTSISAVLSCSCDAAFAWRLAYFSSRALLTSRSRCQTHPHSNNKKIERGGRTGQSNGRERTKKSNDKSTPLKKKQE